MKRPGWRSTKTSRTGRASKPSSPSWSSAGFLPGKTRCTGYVRLVAERAADYNGFSLLVGDVASMFFFSNRGGRAARVAPGVHGLSNHLLDTPWPKVEKAKAALAALLDGPFDSEALFGLLNDTGRPPGSGPPST